MSINRTISSVCEISGHQCQQRCSGTAAGAKCRLDSAAVTVRPVQRVDEVKAFPKRVGNCEPSIKQRRRRRLEADSAAARSAGMPESRDMHVS